jgi:hypothetical protein
LLIDNSSIPEEPGIGTTHVVELAVAAALGASLRQQPSHGVHRGSSVGCEVWPGADDLATALPAWADCAGVTDAPAKSASMARQAGARPARIAIRRVIDIKPARKDPIVCILTETGLRQMETRTTTCRFWPRSFDVSTEPNLIRSADRIANPDTTGATTMRFMVMVRATKDSEAGVLPSEALLSAMGKYNEELVKAGIMLAGEGLQPSSKGARIRFSGDKRTVIDGPFSETKELIAGFWLWQCRSKEEAIEWAKRCPNPMPGESELEIRQVFEAEDFGEEFTPELREQERRIGEQMAANAKR